MLHGTCQRLNMALSQAWSVNTETALSHAAAISNDDLVLELLKHPGHQDRFAFFFSSGCGAFVVLDKENNDVQIRVAMKLWLFAMLCAQVSSKG